MQLLEDAMRQISAAHPDFIGFELGQKSKPRLLCDTGNNNRRC